MPPSETDKTVAGAAPARALICDYSNGGRAAADVLLAVEAPLNIVYGGVPFAVMMTTPSDLEDFVTGFSITEGVIDSPDEIRALSFHPVEGGMKADVQIAGERMQAHLARSRTMAGRTGCGVCGIADIEALPRRRQALAPGGTFALASIARAVAAIDGAQPLGMLTRAMHAAAWCSAEGRIMLIREDAGRHNALDKLIGALARARTQARDGFIVITSRASYEMVEKAAVFGASCLVAISAPTSLAVERARALGMTLAGIARHDSVVVYCGQERIKSGDGA